MQIEIRAEIGENGPAFVYTSSDWRMFVNSLDIAHAELGELAALLNGTPDPLRDGLLHRVKRSITRAQAAALRDRILQVIAERVQSQASWMAEAASWRYEVSVDGAVSELPSEEPLP